MSVLADRVALVTGGTSGIGRATAVLLGEMGAMVAFSGRSRAKGAALEAALKAAGVRTRFMRSELRREADVRAMVQTVVDEFRALDILINCAGINVRETLGGPSGADWDRLFDVNVRGTWLSCREALPHLIASQGCIVNLGSVSGTVGVADGPAYAASKAAVINLTKSLALAYADRGVRINVVCPGPVDTPMTAGSWTATGAEIGMRRALAMSPVRRLATDREVAKVICFLAGPDASYITGASVMVDGGKSAGMMPATRYAES